MEEGGGTGGTKGRNTSGEATGPPGHDFIPGGVSTRRLVTAETPSNTLEAYTEAGEEM